MAVIVRAPRDADADALARINIETWRDAYADIVSEATFAAMTPEAYRATWQTRIAGHPGVAFFVAEIEGAVVGYAVGGPYRVQQDARPEDVAGWAEVFALYVDPPHQGSGVGVSLHEALLAQLADDGHRRAALWVLEANTRAQGWYEAREWRPDGEVSGWHTEDQVLPEIRMTREL